MEVVAHYESAGDDRYAKDVRQLVFHSKCTRDEMFSALMVIVRAAQSGSVEKEEAKWRQKRDEKLKRKAGCCFNLCCCCAGGSRVWQVILIIIALMFVQRVVSQLMGYMRG